MNTKNLKMPSFTINQRISKLWKPLLILTLVFSFIHYFIFQVATLSILGPEFDSLRWALAGLLVLGTLIIPVGYMVTLTSYKKQLRGLTWLNYIWMGTFHLLFHFSLVEFIIQLIYPHHYSYWVLLAGFIIAAWSLWNGMRFPRLNKYELKANPATAGLKIVQISDLHIGMLHLNQDWLEKVVQKINEQNPDMIAITGDLVEGPYSEVSPQLEPLKKLKARYAKFYITGNHEYIHNSGPWENRLKELGFSSLHNSSEVVRTEKASILVAGVPDRMVKRFTDDLESNPDKALASSGSAEKFDFKILLAHEPASAFDLKKETCDVILTGHTHGGQIFPFWFYVRAVQPVVTGFKKVNSQLVFAHQGTGFWGPPMRWLSESEIAVFELKN